MGATGATVVDGGRPRLVVILRRPCGIRRRAAHAQLLHPADAVVALMQQTQDAERFGPAAVQLAALAASHALRRAHDGNPDRDRGRDRSAVPARRRRSRWRSRCSPRARRSAPASCRSAVGDRAVIHDANTGPDLRARPRRHAGVVASSVGGARRRVRRRRARDPTVRGAAPRARRAGRRAHDHRSAAEAKRVTTEVRELVPELRTDFERRNIGSECVVWSPLAGEPTVLDAVATVMLDVIDGSASIGQLATEVHEEVGVPLETAQSTGHPDRRALRPRRSVRRRRRRTRRAAEAIASRELFVSYSRRRARRTRAASAP